MKSTFMPDHVTVVFNSGDWARLMMILGFANAKAGQDQDFFRMIIRFANEINAGNPKFTPFEVPTK